MNQKTEEAKRIQYWRYIFIPILIALLGLIPFMCNRIDAKKADIPKPKFSIIGGHAINANKPYILVKPINKSADKKMNLDVKIGNTRLTGICQLIPNLDETQWKLQIDLIEPQILKSKFKNGENEIDFGFIEQDLWDTQSIYIKNLNDFLLKPPSQEADKKPYIKQGKNKNKELIKLEEEKTDHPYYEAKGACIIKKDATIIETQSILLATKCASMVAKAELLEIIKGIEINKNVYVKDFMLENMEIQGQVEGVLEFAYQYGKPVTVEDKVEVIFRVDKEKISNIISKN